MCHPGSTEASFRIIEAKCCCKQELAGRGSQLKIYAWGLRFLAGSWEARAAERKVHSQGGVSQGTSRQALGLASDITLVLWFWFLSILFVDKYPQTLPADSVDTENRARGQVRLVPALQHLSCGGEGHSKERRH